MENTHEALIDEATFETVQKRLSVKQPCTWTNVDRIVVHEKELEGNEIIMQEPEQIHTFMAWKELGFMVRKGEKAVDSFSIWKYTSRKKPNQTEEETQEEGHCFLKYSHFFAAHQVQPIA